MLTFDYLFILLAVVCYAAQFAFTKLFEGAAGQSGAVSLVMLAGSSVVGALLFFFVGGISVRVSEISLLWALVFAVVMIPYYMIGIKVLSLGSLAVYSMFMMLGGMLVPFFYGILFLKEAISWGKVLGTVLIALFIVLQATVQKESDGARQSNKRLRWIFFALCLLIFFINGMTGVVAKAHSISEGAVDESSFTVLYCAMTAALSLVLLVPVLCRKEGRREAKRAVSPRALLWMALLGAAAYGGNFLQLLAADAVPASVQFPLVSGGVIVLSALASALCFREALSKKEWISVAGAFLSTFLFAF